MKTLLITITAFALLAACDAGTTSTIPTSGPNSLVWRMDKDYKSVYVITIDEDQYILVSGSSGTAICPRVRGTTQKP